MLAEILIFFVVLLLAYFVWNRMESYKVRERLGIPGPKPNFLFGNMKDLMSATKKYPDHGFKILQEWRQKYGNYFGYFIGPKLMVVTFDLDMAKEVFIKQFDCFVDRMHFALNDRRFARDSVIQSTGDYWKHTRNSVTPTFTASKMKQMSGTVHNKIDTLLNKLDNFAKNKESLDIYDAFQALTLDVIGQCAFAVNVNCQTDPNDPFLIHCQNFFRMADIKMNPLLTAAIFFPELDWLLTKFYSFTNFGKEELWLLNILQKVVDDRRKNIKNHQQSVDVLQLLLDQQESERKVMHNSEKKLKHSEIITDDAIVGNAFVFLLAGYETTSTALGYTAWLLAKHRDVQTKLQTEIDEKVSLSDVVNYDLVHKLPYLDAVYHESLRLYPPVVQFLTRTCVKECDIGPIHFLPGMQVNVPVWEIHRDPDIWAEPEKFYPERFIDSTYSPMAWLPFGVGPRNCVGMRFADMEYKMALVRILQRFNIVFGPESEDPLRTAENNVMMRPKNGVVVRVEKR